MGHPLKEIDVDLQQCDVPSILKYDKAVHIGAVQERCKKGVRKGERGLSRQKSVKLYLNGPILSISSVYDLKQSRDV